MRLEAGATGGDRGRDAVLFFHPWLLFFILLFAASGSQSGCHTADTMPATRDRARGWALPETPFSPVSLLRKTNFSRSAPRPLAVKGAES